MFNVRLAEIVFCIDNKYDYVEKMCADYICNDAAEVNISVTEEEIKAEQPDTEFDNGYLESLAIYRKIAEEMPGFNGFLLHGATIDVEGEGVTFLAKSGVGKSTHMSLWKRCLGKKLTVVNGDKPLVRILDGHIYAYGTPWAGKEKEQTNMRTELKKICFLERADKNSCMQIAKEAVTEKIFSQIFRPTSGAKIIATMDLMEKLIKLADFYLIFCNKEISAAETAISVVIGSEIERELRKNKVYITNTRGDSMTPMLQTGDKVIIAPVSRKLKKYDIPVYRRGDHYTMHRIVRVTDSGYVICGDNRTYLERDVKDSDIIGVLAGFYKDGQFVDSDSAEFMKYAKKAVNSYWLRRVKAKIKSIIK